MSFKHMTLNEFWARNSEISKKKLCYDVLDIKKFPLEMLEFIVERNFPYFTYEEVNLSINYIKKYNCKLGKILYDL